MVKIRKVPRSETTWQYHFVCPGCDCEHAFDDRWKFNKDFDNPTISPSYLITYSHSSEERNKISIDYHKKHGRYLTVKELPHDIHDRCHCFIKNGTIQFLGDCTHELKGKTVPLPENPHETDYYKNKESNHD